MLGVTTSTYLVDTLHIYEPTHSHNVVINSVYRSCTLFSTSANILTMLLAMSHILYGRNSTTRILLLVRDLAIRGGKKGTLKKNAFEKRYVEKNDFRKVFSKRCFQKGASKEVLSIKEVLFEIDILKKGTLKRVL